VYSYETDTTLWIKDVSEDARSVVTLKSTVMIISTGSCNYMLRMRGSSLNGDSLNQQDLSSVTSFLDTYGAVFRLNQQGEIFSEVKFQPEDQPWSRNIKRGIISAFQVKPESELRKLDSLSELNEKSVTVYETDVLGRCRTTYRLDSNDSNQLKLNKQKSTHTCDQRSLLSDFHYTQTHSISVHNLLIIYF
jgi:hypothetical protein